MKNNQHISILIIEDNPGDQYLLHENLISTNLLIREIIMVETLAEGINRLNEQKFSLVFLDLFLADSNGLDSLSQLMKVDSGIPVIIYSGLSDSQIAVKAITLGAQDFLIKGDYAVNLLEKTVRYSIERKIAEEELNKLSLVAKKTINGVIISDKNQNIVWVNNAFTKMSGYTLDEVIGRNLMQFLNGKEAGVEIIPGLNEKLLSKEPFVFEILNYSKTHEKYYMSVQVQPIFDDNGNIKQFFALQTDITRQKELEEKVELEKSVKQKEITDAVFVAQERERSEIGRELHDNVNQLLGASRLYIDLAKKDTESRDSLLTSASASTLNAIEEIRKLSKKFITPLIKDIGLKDSVKDLVAEIMMLHPVKIFFTNDFIEDEFNDKFKLNIFRIIQEQINNILKHARAKNIEINLEENYGRFLLSITDNGIGFDTTKRKCGVGITNIRTRSELYNGILVLTSEQGTGTSLAITFNEPSLLMNGQHHHTY